MTRKCAACGNELVDRSSSRAIYCFPCARARSKAKVTMTGADIARYFVNVAVGVGILERADAHKCVDCGVPATCYDHRDYNKPLEVEPVCSKCNFHRGAAIPLKRKNK